MCTPILYVSSGFQASELSKSRHANLLNASAVCHESENNLHFLAVTLPTPVHPTTDSPRLGPSSSLDVMIC